MNDGLATAAPSPPRWLVWAWLGLLVLPFHPYWLDFEQVRRGLLLVLTGASLLVHRSLRPVRGEALMWALIGCFAASALIQGLGEAWFGDAKATATFQPWDAVYRIAHWLALLVVMRLGAASGSGVGLPLATLLALTSAFGLLQRLGLGNIAGYGVEREPVSVFGNLNVASECTAVAAIAVASIWSAFTTGRQRALAASALVLAGCYLVVDQSRSGMLALPGGLAVLAVLHRRQRGWLPLALAAAGGLLGLLLGVTAPRPEPVDGNASRTELRRGTSTLAVRFEIAKGTGLLLAQAPLFGLGPGQFAVHYPRVRSQEEIEASSHGRQFPTEVRTVHDDWLELMVDGGVFALLAFAALVLVLQRHQRDKARLLPLFVLLMLMLVRAPLWNAPAAAIAFWLVGVPADAAPSTSRWRRPALLLLGVLLVALGIPVLVANQLATSWQRAVARAEQPPLDGVTAASAWMPFEPRWLEILTRERLAARDFRGAEIAGARAIKLRPHHPQLYLNLAEVLAKGAKFPEALAVARAGLAIDPPSPELRVLVSTVLTQQKDVDSAITAVVEQPHPMLRSQLVSHFRQLAQLCRDRGDEPGEARFTVELHGTAAIDGLGNTNDEVRNTTTEHIRQMVQAMQRAGLLDDVRPLVLTALNLLDQHLPQAAIKLGARTADFPPLLPWQRELLGAQLDRLRTLESWQPFFARR